MAYKNNLKSQQFILNFLKRKTSIREIQSHVCLSSKLQSAGTLGHFKLKNFFEKFYKNPDVTNR